MSHHHSLSMIVAAADHDAANLWMEGIGRGPGTFSVPLSANGQGPATHYGAHSFDDELLKLLQAGSNTAITFHSAEDGDPSANFEALLASQGLQSITPEI